MAGLPWYAHSIQDYERKTSHLSMLEHGAYRLMMDHYYKTSAPLPPNAEHVYRICRAFAEQERCAVDTILQQFFLKREDGWHNERADEELARMSSISGKRRNAAKTRHSEISTSNANAEQMHAHLQEHIQESPSLRSGGATPKRAKSRRSLPDGFPDQPDLVWARDHWLRKGRADLCELIGDEVEKFRDHHRGKATMSADWPGSWRTWARNAMKFTNPPNGKAHGRPSAHSAFAIGAHLAADDEAA